MDRLDFEYILDNTHVFKPAPSLVLEGTAMEIPFSVICEDEDVINLIRVLEGSLFVQAFERQELPKDVVSLLEGFDSGEAWKFANQELPRLFAIPQVIGFAKAHVQMHTHQGLLNDISNNVVSRSTKSRLIISAPITGWEVALLSSASKGIRIRPKSS